MFLPLIRTKVPGISLFVILIHLYRCCSLVRYSVTHDFQKFALILLIDLHINDKLLFILEGVESRGDIMLFPIRT